MPIPQAADPGPEAARAARVEHILAQVDSLPTLSPVAGRLLAVGKSSDADMKEVVTLIESDPALSSRLLGLCRRADKGLGDRITTVKRAVLMLGFEAVRSAALSVSVYDQMEHGDNTRRDLDRQISGEGTSDITFDRRGFWLHLLAVACASEIIADAHPKLRIAGPDAFLCGLLHAIGKLVLQYVLPLAYERVLRLARHRFAASATVELEVLGVDYQVCGDRIATHWNLPGEVGVAAMWHAQPPSIHAEGSQKNLVRIVGAAKCICRELHLGWSGDFDPPPSAARAWRVAELDKSGPDAVEDKLFTALGERCAVLGLGEASPTALLRECIARANLHIQEASLAR